MAIEGPTRERLPTIVGLQLRYPVARPGTAGAGDRPRPDCPGRRSCVVSRTATKRRAPGRDGLGGADDAELLPLQAHVDIADDGPQRTSSTCAGRVQRSACRAVRPSSAEEAPTVSYPSPASGSASRRTASGAARAAGTGGVIELPPSVTRACPSNSRTPSAPTSSDPSEGDGTRQRPSSAPLHQPSPSTGLLFALCVTPRS